MPTFKMICPLVDFQIPIMFEDREMTREELDDYLKALDVDLIFGLDLGDGVVLKRLLEAELEEFKEAFLIGPSSSLSSAEIALEKRVRVGNEEEFKKVRFDAEKALRNAVLALRLLKEGCFASNFVFCVLIALAEKNEPKFWSYTGEQRSRSCSFSYSLRLEEVPDLRKLFMKIQSADFEKCESLNLACTRFQRACEEDDCKDRIMNLMVAFEALLQGRGGEKESRVAIASECSNLLGRNEEEIQEIWRVLYEAHRIRNLMICGSEYGPEDDPAYILDVASRTENCLRESIKRILRVRDVQRSRKPQLSGLMLT